MQLGLQHGTEVLYREIVSCKGPNYNRTIVLLQIKLVTMIGVFLYIYDVLD